MRFQANENFPRNAVLALRSAGHDVTWIRTDRPGAADEEVLAIAIAEVRILLTFDKDFGYLAFNARLPATCGIVLFRLRKKSPDLIADRVVAVLQSRDDWAGSFCIVEPGRIRMRALPKHD